jgi:hypothetical protein
VQELEEYEDPQGTDSDGLEKRVSEVTSLGRPRFRYVDVIALVSLHDRYLYVLVLELSVVFSLDG